MRVRMTLLPVRGEWYFEPDWLKVKKLRLKKISDAAVEKEGTLIEKIDSLRQSIVVERVPAGMGRGRGKRKRTAD
jgi:hypothetical protein